MADLTFGQLIEFLRLYGYDNVDTIVFSQPNSGGPMANEFLANLVIQTHCEYGDAIIRFNGDGDLYSVRVGDVSAKERRVDYHHVADVIRTEGYIDPTCVRIAYCAPGWGSCLVNSEYSGRTIYAQCGYGNATIDFNDAGDLEVVEIC